MATASTTSTKRKRNQVSYVADDYFDKMDIDEEPASEDDGIGSEDEDVNFGSRKIKGRAKKKQRLTLKSKPKEKKEQPFRFLDLPAELRDEIYELALLEPDGVTLVPRTKNYRRTVTRGPIATEDGSNYHGRRRRQRYRRWYRRNDDSQTSKVGEATRRLSPNLLAVNKQIREEATGILYGQEIILEDTTALQIFITQIGPYNRERLLEVTLKGWGEGRGVHKGHNFAALSILSTCTNLQTLFLDCSIGWYRNPKLLARQLYRDGFFFLEAIGAARGKFDAGLDVLEVCDWHFDKNQRGYYSTNQEPEYDETKKEEYEQELRKLLKR